MPTNTNGGTTVSFSNTPQAVDDLLTKSASGSLITEDSTTIVLDVMANDLGGNAKSLWSLDDGSSASTATKIYAPVDLLPQDTARSEAASSDFSAKGAHIWITAGGKVGYDTSTFSAATKASLQALAVGESSTDTFTYAIRLANGTLSWATAKVVFIGTNDGVMITSGPQAGAVTEDADTTPSTTDSLIATGTVAFNDVDLSDTHTASFAAAAGNTTALGTFALAALSELPNAADGSVNWTYTLNNAAAQYLAQGQTITETYVVSIDDGHGSTVTQNVLITIAGTNDAPVAVADTNAGDAVVESGVNPANTPFAGDATAVGNVLANDTDVDNGAVLTVSAVNGAAGNVGNSITGTYGSVVINGDGSYTYTLDNADADTNALAQDASKSETFGYTVSDEHGATSNATLTIAITGTNDAPVAVDDTFTPTALAGEALLTFNDVDGYPAFDYQGFHFSGNAGGYYSFFNASPYYYGTGGSGSAYTYGDGGAIQRIDGADFGVVSVDAASYFYAGSPVSFLGYNDGVQVASLTTAVDPYYYTPYGGANGHITFGSEFSQIDQLLVIPSNFDYTFIDNLSIGSIATENFAADIDVLGNDTDVDTGAVLNVAALDATSAMGAALSLNPDCTVHYSSIGVVAIDALAEGEAVSDTFSYTVTDEWGATDTATVTVQLTGQNDGPVSHADSNADDAVDESGVKPGNTPFIGDATAAGNVLANDTDVDNGALLTVSAVNGLAGNVGTSITGTFGSVAINADGSYLYTLDNDDTDTNALAQDASASEVFNYTLSDEHGATSTTTLTIAITGTNDAPVAHADSNDSGGAPAGFVFNPDTGHYYGIVAAGDWWISQGQAQSIGGYLATVTSAAENEFIRANLDPTGEWMWLGASDDGSQGTSEGNWIWATGPEAGTQFWQGPYLPYGGSVGGEYSNWQPGSEPNNSGGAENFAHMWVGGYWNDLPGSAALRGIVEIEVDPVVESGVNPDNTPFAGDPTAVGNVLANDRDVDTGATKTVSEVNGAAGNVGTSITGTYGSVVINADGSYTYTLDNNDLDTNALAQDAQASDMFHYTVSDEHGATSSTTLTIAITGTNDVPVAESEKSVIVMEGTAPVSLNISAPTDVDTSDVLTATITGLPTNGAVTLSNGTAVSNGQSLSIAALQGLKFAATSNAGDSTSSFAYSVSDGHGGSDTAVVNVQTLDIVKTFQYVGFYEVNDGPSWPTNPPVYSGVGAAALLFGGSSNEYSISINSSQDPTTITHTAYYDGWGEHSGMVFADTYSLDAVPAGYSAPGGTATARSAYVSDGLSNAYRNYVWRQDIAGEAINGMAGNDVLSGGAGKDTLTGGAGNDLLTGAGGSDTFVYQSLGDRGTTGDVITDFTRGAGGDVLDLHDMLSGFGGYNGSNAFSGGFLRFAASGADTLVQVDSNGGADSWATLATLTNTLLTPADTANYIV